MGRVRVYFPWGQQGPNNDSEEMITPWIRVEQAYAGTNRGAYIIPEKNDEVMVDFEGGNAEMPYVRSSIFNCLSHMDNEWACGKTVPTNQIKAIRTHNGHTIEVHDEGKDGYIRIYDYEKENYILTFSTDEKLIKLESTGNIELYAKKDIIMKNVAETTIEYFFFRANMPVTVSMEQITTAISTVHGNIMVSKYASIYSLIS